MRQKHKECAKISGLSEKEIDKIHNYPRDGDDENMRKHLVCLVKKLNYLNEDGTLNTEAMRKKLTNLKITDDQMEKIMKDCITKKSTEEETVANYVKCKHEILGPMDLKLFD